VAVCGSRLPIGSVSPGRWLKEPEYQVFPSFT
jgi:hypothetical protein